MAFTNKKDVNLNDPSFLSMIRGGVTSSSGVKVDDATALADSTYVSCIKVKSQTLGQLPVEIFRVVNDEEVKVENNVMLNTFSKKPNKRQTFQEFIELGVCHLDLGGNYYAHITKNVRGEIVSLQPFNNTKSVTVNQLPNNDVSYTVTFPDGTGKTYPSSEILHIKGLAYNTYKGLNMVDIASETLGLATAAQEHASTFYKNGSAPGGFLQSKKTLTKEAQQRLISQFEDRHLGSGKAHRLAVLEEGLEYKALQVSMRESQLIESRKQSVEEICRMLGVPPQMIGYNAGITFSSVEEMNRFFYNSTLGALISKFENGINKHMPESYYIRFDVSKFTKADAATTAEVVDKMFKSSMITINEGRKRLGLPPVPGGDVFAVDTNNHTLGSIEDIQKIPNTEEVIKVEEPNIDSEIIEEEQEKGEDNA